MESVGTDASAVYLGEGRSVDRAMEEAWLTDVGDEIDRDEELASLLCQKNVGLQTCGHRGGEWFEHEVEEEGENREFFVVPTTPTPSSMVAFGDGGRRDDACRESSMPNALPQCHPLEATRQNVTPPFKGPLLSDEELESILYRPIENSVLTPHTSPHPLPPRHPFPAPHPLPSHPLIHHHLRLMEERMSNSLPRLMEEKERERERGIDALELLHSLGSEKENKTPQQNLNSEPRREGVKGRVEQKGKEKLVAARRMRKVMRDICKLHTPPLQDEELDLPVKQTSTPSASRTVEETGSKEGGRTTPTQLGVKEGEWKRCARRGLIAAEGRRVRLFQLSVPCGGCTFCPSSCQRPKRYHFLLKLGPNRSPSSFLVRRSAVRSVPLLSTTIRKLGEPRQMIEAHPTFLSHLVQSMDMRLCSSVTTVVKRGGSTFRKGYLISPDSSPLLVCYQREGEVCTVASRMPRHLC